MLCALPNPSPWGGPAFWAQNGSVSVTLSALGSNSPTRVILGRSSTLRNQGIRRLTPPTPRVCGGNGSLSAS